MPSAGARLWITSRMSARSKLRTIASSSPSGRSPSSGGAGSAASGGGAGGGLAGAAGLGWAHTAPGAPSASTSRPIEIDRPFTSSSSLSAATGYHSASHTWRPASPPAPERLLAYRLRPLFPAAGSLVVLPKLLELLTHLRGKRLLRLTLRDPRRPRSRRDSRDGRPW